MRRTSMKMYLGETLASHCTRREGLWKTCISLKSGEQSTSISPVMFSCAKWRRSVISRRTRFASATFSSARVTILIATGSPEISSAAELDAKNGDEHETHQ